MKALIHDIPQIPVFPGQDLVRLHKRFLILAFPDHGIGLIMQTESEACDRETEPVTICNEGKKTRLHRACGECFAQCCGFDGMNSPEAEVWLEQSARQLSLEKLWHGHSGLGILERLQRLRCGKMVEIYKGRKEFEVLV